MNFQERLLRAIEILSEDKENSSEENIYLRILLQAHADELWEREQFFSNPRTPRAHRAVTMSQVAANRVAHSVIERHNKEPK